RPFERELDVTGVADGAGYLPRAWATLEIERLLAEDAARHRDAIVALSKAMHVMTPFTSLLVLESEEQYEQYHVERGRKDRWALYVCPEKIKVVYEPLEGQEGDPSRGVKPSARRVLETVTVRPAPQWLTGPQSPTELRRARRDPEKAVTLEASPFRRPPVEFQTWDVAIQGQAPLAPREDGRWATTTAPADSPGLT